MKCKTPRQNSQFRDQKTLYIFLEKLSYDRKKKKETTYLATRQRGNQSGNVKNLYHVNQIVNKLPTIIPDDELSLAQNASSKNT